MKQIKVLLSLAAIAFGPSWAAWAGDAPPLRDRSWKDDPRVGGSLGQLRYRIARSPYEEVATPDVVTLTDGTRLEAYFLEFYGDWLVFHVKETGRSWLKEQIPRSQVTNVDFHQYLERDPVEPPVIEPARKQPIPKEEWLHGVFRGRQGRYTTWTAEFRSEIDKRRDHAEDATEFGIVRINSCFEEGRGDGRVAHEVRVRGRYHLYAPNTVRNAEWVLVLSELVHSEVDRSPEVELSTETIPNETFILHFDEKADSFRLEWSNIGEWSWTPLVGVRFERAEAAAVKSTPEPATLRPSAAPSSGAAPARTRKASPPAYERSAEESARDLLATSPAAPEPSRTTLVVASQEQTPTTGAHRLQVEGWRRPTSFWGRRR